MAVNNSIDSKQELSPTSNPTFNSLTLTTPLIGTYGGTGVNNSTRTMTYGGNVTFSGAFNVTFTFTGDTSVTFPTSGTLATTAGSIASITGSANQVLVNGTSGIPQTGAVTLTTPQFIGTTSTPTFGAMTLSGAGAGLNIQNNTAISGQNIGVINFLGLNSSAGSIFYGRITPSIVDNTAGTEDGKILFSVEEGGVFTDYFNIDGSTATVNFSKPLSLSTPLGLSNGGTAKSLTASAGGIVWTDSDSMEVLAGVASANRALLSGNLATPAWSTATYPSTTTVNQILYSSASNTISGLATANNGTLVTSNTGVPSILAGPGSTGRMLQSNSAAAPSWSTATFPSTGGTSGNVLISDGTNYISSTSLWPNTVGTSGKFIISNGTSNGYSTSTIPTSAGATANKVLLSDGTNYVLSTPTFPNASATSGKIIISDGTNWIASTPTYPNTSGTAGKILRSDGTNNVYSTSTFSDTYTASNLLYSNGSNTVTGLATANNGTLITSGTGVPSISSTLPNAVQDNITRLGTISTVYKNTANAGFYAYLSSNVTNATGDGTTYTIILNSTNFDIASNFNTGTGTFTAPTTGIYQFNYTIKISNMGAAHTIGYSALVVSGTSAASYQAWNVNPANCRDANNNLAICGAATVKMTSGDTCVLQVTVSNSTKTVTVKGTAISAGEQSSLSGFLVTAL